MIMADGLLGSCHPPELEHGHSVGEGDGSTWTGSLSCHPGYTLVGTNRLKCRDGLWSSRMPVCAVVGRCDPDFLPEIQHGRREPYKSSLYRGAVYR